MEMLLQEKQALETFSGQRDALMTEVAQLTKQKDSLLLENRMLIESNTQTRLEHDTLNELMVEQAKGKGALDEKVKSIKDSLMMEMDFMNDEKRRISIELNEKKTFLIETSESVDKISREVSQVKNSLSSIYQDIHNAATWMKESVVDIRKVVDDIKNSSIKFSEEQVKKQEEIKDRIIQLDKKESLILARERAVDEKYIEYLKKVNLE